MIAHELGPSWKMFGRVLKVPDAVIDQIDVNESDVTEKCYRKCNCVVCIVDFAMLRSVIVFRGHQNEKAVWPQ